VSRFEVLGERKKSTGFLNLRGMQNLEKRVSGGRGEKRISSDVLNYHNALHDGSFQSLSGKDSENLLNGGSGGGRQGGSLEI